MGFIEWGYHGDLDYQSTQIELTVSKVVDYLESVINIASEGKAVLIPIINTMDKDLGYQALERHRKTDSRNYLPDSGFFKIDINKDPNYRQILRHCTYLMLSDSCGFIVYKWHESLRYGGLGEFLQSNTEMITAFTRERVLSPEDIYSIETTNKYKEYNRYNTYKIEVSGYSTLFRPTHREWNELWITPYVWTKGTPSSSLTFYIAKILRDRYMAQFFNLFL